MLAAASSNANTNVSMMGESFKYVAPVAGAMGYSAEDYKTGLFTGPGVFTIVEVRSGTGSRSGWGRLLSGVGWISLDYCEVMK